jgi:hypothetical protein
MFFDNSLQPYFKQQHINNLPFTHTVNCAVNTFFALQMYIKKFDYAHSVLKKSVLYIVFYRILPHFTDFFRILPILTDFYRLRGRLPFVERQTNGKRTDKCIKKTGGIFVKENAKVTKNLKKFGYLKKFLLFCSVEKCADRHRKLNSLC